MQNIEISYSQGIASLSSGLADSLGAGTVCTIGHFDGVHLGHQHVIGMMRQVAAQRGLQHTVAVTFDRHPRTLFDASFVPRMLSTVEERRHLLSLSGIDICALLHFDLEMSAMTAREFMQVILHDMLNVRVILLGYDNRFGRRNESEGFEDYVRYGKEMGIDVLACNEKKATDGHMLSSTAIRELLSDGYADVAAEYLGHPYILEGVVVEGYHEGRKLGFPTANMQIDPAKLIPAGGVYAVKVRVEGSMTDMHGMMNIGKRPTYGDNNLTIETNIFRFDDDIYGKRLCVMVYKRLRNERLFTSVGKLSEQLRIDAVQADQYLNALTDGGM